MKTASIIDRSFSRNCEGKATAVSVESRGRSAAGFVKNEPAVYPNPWTLWKLYESSWGHRFSRACENCCCFRRVKGSGSGDFFFQKRTRGTSTLGLYENWRAPFFHSLTETLPGCSCWETFLVLRSKWRDNWASCFNQNGRLIERSKPHVFITMWGLESTEQLVSVTMWGLESTEQLVSVIMWGREREL